MLARTVSIDASFDPDDPGRFSPEQHEGGNGGIIMARANDDVGEVGRKPDQ